MVGPSWPGSCNSSHLYLILVLPCIFLLQQIGKRQNTENQYLVATKRILQPPLGHEYAAEHQPREPMTRAVLLISLNPARLNGFSIDHERPCRQYETCRHVILSHTHTQEFVLIFRGLSPRSTKTVPFRGGSTVNVAAAAAAQLPLRCRCHCYLLVTNPVPEYCRLGTA